MREIEEHKKIGEIREIGENWGIVANLGKLGNIREIGDFWGHC